MRAVLPLLLILAGCTSGDVMTTGKGSYQVDCGGPFSSKLECNEKASRMCPSGFNPVSSPPGRLVFTCSKRSVPATAPI